MAYAATGFGARGVLRRALGPTAWVVLEVLVERSEELAGERVSVTSVRAVASELGVAKNTAARALSMLRTAGVITVAQGRDAAGRFAEASYVIHAARGAADTSTVDTPVAQRSVPDARPRPTPRHRRVDTGQLTLLEHA